MAGFVRVPQADYRTVTARLLEKAYTAPYALEINRFADTVESVASDADERVMQPGFYDGRTTALAHIIRTLVQRSRVGESVLLLSDMVQEGSSQDALDLVEALRAAAGRFPEVRLLAFRSTYIRRYPTFVTVERTTAPLSGRPFYLLALGPDRARLDEVERYVFGGLGAAQIFDARLSAEVSGVAQPPLEPGAAWLRVRQEAAEECPGGRAWLSYVRRSTQDTGSLQFIVEATPHVRIRDLGGLAARIEEASFPGGASTPSKVTARVELAADRKTTGGGTVQGTTAWRATYSVPEPARGKWRAYRVRLKGGRGNFAVPSWVSDWSTRPGMDDLKRTANLEMLVEALLRAVTEDVIILDHVVVVGGA